VFLSSVIAAAVLAIGTAAAAAADWFVAPLGATARPTAAGTLEDPFVSVHAAITSGRVQGGDRILLLEGEHGPLVLHNRAFASEVTIASLEGRKAHVDNIEITGTSRNLRISRLSVWPRDPKAWRGYLAQTDITVTDVVFESLEIRSARDAYSFMDWDVAKWRERRASGIRMNGPRSTAVRNRIIGVYMGITLMGADSQALRNLVNGYDGDGLRGFGPNTLFHRNRVLNCVDTDDNHDDGFQSFTYSGSGPIRKLTLDGNVIIEWTGAESHPLRCRLQGIGLFAGFYEDLTIINNLVVASQYHGISVYGARRAKIINNTVVHNFGKTTLTPYILITDNKDGTPSSDVLVANNVAMSVRGKVDPANRVEFRNNSVIGTPGAVFENAFAFDYRPKPSSGFIDTADPSVAPPHDMLNQRRPGGALPDRGAYEVLPGMALSEEATETGDDLAAGGDGTVTETPTPGAPGPRWIKLPGTP
jgi:hypothetical protein